MTDELFNVLREKKYEQKTWYLQYFYAIQVSQLKFQDTCFIDEMRKIFQRVILNDWNTEMLHGSSLITKLTAKQQNYNGLVYFFHDKNSSSTTSE